MKVKAILNTTGSSITNVNSKNTIVVDRPKSSGARVKGYFKVVETGEVKKFQFNPPTLGDSQSFTYALLSSPMSNYPKFQYIGTTDRTFSLNLFVVSNKEVDSWVRFFDNLKPKSRFTPPKTLIFTYGNITKRCVLTTITRNFLEFDTNLKPIKAEFVLAFSEV